MLWSLLVRAWLGRCMSPASWKASNYESRMQKWDIVTVCHWPKLSAKSGHSHSHFISSSSCLPRQTSPPSSSGPCNALRKWVTPVRRQPAHAHWVALLQMVSLCSAHGFRRSWDPQILAWGMVWHLPESVKTSTALAAFSPLTDTCPSIFLSNRLLLFSLFFFSFSFFLSFFFLSQHLALPSHLPNSKTPSFQSVYLWTTSSQAQIKSLPSFGICRSWAWSVKVQTLSDQPFPW